ncbi:MAG: ROK family protein [Acidimicrobiales bacterium]
MATYVAGLDIGGTKSLGVVLDDQGVVVAESRVPTPHGAEALLATVEMLVEDLANVVGVVSAVGLGVPGLVTTDGLFRFAPNLIAVSELPVGDLLRERFDVPVIVNNDANCAVWAEHEVGGAVGVDHAVLITIGTGIGTGLLIDGQIERGAHGFAGEMGHTIVDAAGAACACGRRGCWETIASGSGLAIMGRELVAAGRGTAILILAGGDAESIRGEHVTRAARRGDDEALGLLRQFAWNIGLGLANVSAMLDPELVLLGGGLVAELDILLDDIRAAHDELVMGAGHREPLRIEPVGLGERSGAMGAALLGAEAIS